MKERSARRVLLVGPAGSGKTRRALALVSECLRGTPARSFLFIAPTEEHLRHVSDVILSAGDLRGLLENRFATFSTLARRIASANARAEPITRETQDVVLQSLLANRCPPAFRDAARFAGFRRELAGLLREVKEAGLGPAQLREAIESALRPADDSARGRLSALAQLYSDYQGELEALQYLDHEDVLARAVEIARDDPTVFSDVDTLVVDSFWDYTSLQMNLLALAASRIPHVLVTCPGARAGEDRPHFEPAARTRRRLLRLLDLDEQTLSKNRRARCDDLELVERWIFAGTGVPAAARDSAVSFLEAADRADEVEEISRRIRSLVDGGDYDYRDIALIVRGEESYRVLVEETFRRHRIPVSFRTGRPLALAPFARSALALARVLAADFPDEEFLTLARSAHFGVGPESADRLACAFLASRRAQPARHWDEIIRATGDDRLRDYWGRIGEAREELASRTDTPEMCRALQRAIAGFMNLGDLFTDDGDLPRARIEEEGRAIRAVWQLLDDMAKVYRKTSPVVDPVALVLSLEGLITQSACGAPGIVRDAVYVLDVFEARQWELPVVFVPGLVEKEFPRQLPENLLLDDGYRARLNDASKTTLRLQEDRQAEERMLFYVAVTRAKEKLCLSWPRYDDEGGENLRSFFLDEVVGLFDEGEATRRTSTRELSSLAPAPQFISTDHDLYHYVCAGLRRMMDARSPADAPATAAWELARSLARESRFGEIAGAALSPAKAELTGLAGERIERAISKLEPHYSATALASYAQCPYRHFAEHVLKLAPIEDIRERMLDPLTAGSIVHEVLEHHLRNPRQNMMTLFNRAFRKRLGEIALGADAMRARREILAVLRDFDSREETFRKEYKLTPKEFERRFSPSRPPALVIPTEGGEIELAGRIDRLDEASEGELLIIDYKYSRGLKKPGLEAGGDGNALQLAVYLLYARDVMKASVIGAELYSLREWRRVGIIRSAFVPKVVPKTGSTVIVDDEEMERFLADWQGWIVRSVAGILAGRIDAAPRPEDLDRCGFPHCPYCDVCRFEKWMARGD